MTKAEEVFRIKLPNGFEYFKTFVDEAGGAESYETGLFIPDLTAAEAREELEEIVREFTSTEELGERLKEIRLNPADFLGDDYNFKMRLLTWARALLAKLPEEEK